VAQHRNSNERIDESKNKNIDEHSRPYSKKFDACNVTWPLSTTWKSAWPLPSTSPDTKVLLPTKRACSSPA